VLNVIVLNVIMLAIMLNTPLRIVAPWSKFT